MIDTKGPADYSLPANEPALFVHQHGAAVSWGAIFAGGVSAAAFALILLTLGTGLGLTSLSPWSTGASNAKAIGFAAVVWVCVTAILTSGLGGYLTGRLRRRWLLLDSDEVHFRDTAHGFLSWALATLLTAIVLTSSAAGIVKAGAQTAAQTGGIATMSTLQRGNARAALDTWPLGYFVDSLFRMPANAAPAQSANVQNIDDKPRAEVARIFLNSAATGDQLSLEDTAYLSRLVAMRTGLSQEAAQARVTTTYSRFLQKEDALDKAAKAAVDTARKITIGASLWLFISLLMGAFSASLAATYGGRVRQL